MRNLILAALVCGTLGACGDEKPAKPQAVAAPPPQQSENPVDQANRIAGQMGDVRPDLPAGTPATSPLCKLFTPEEMAAYAGEPLAAPTKIMTGEGCQWLAKDDDGDVMLQIVPASYHSNNSGSDTYRVVPDVGKGGYSTRALNGWQAGAIVGDKSVNVNVSGPAASADQAVALLKETVKRMAKN